MSRSWCYIATSITPLGCSPLLEGLDAAIARCNDINDAPGARSEQSLEGDSGASSSYTEHRKERVRTCCTPLSPTLRSSAANLSGTRHEPPSHKPKRGKGALLTSIPKDGTFLVGTTPGPVNNQWLQDLPVRGPSHFGSRGYLTWKLR